MEFGVFLFFGCMVAIMTVFVFFLVSRMQIELPAWLAVDK
jgi:hypothetical protein